MSCVLPGEGMNFRISSRISCRRTFIGRETGGGPRVRSPGEDRLCARHREIVWLTSAPQAGREQAGRRPALILRPKKYIAKSGLALACPVTNQVKGYPFEVSVPPGVGTTGVILADYLKSVDWNARHAKPLGRRTEEVMAEVRAGLAPLLGY